MFRAIVTMPSAFAILSIALMSASCGSQGGGAAREDERPNLLLVSIDTCRADALGCYADGPRTPNVDALAAAGIRFANALAPTPVTLPSHSTMLTGTSPPYHGVHDNSDYTVSPSNVSLAEVARDAGYTTGAVVGAYVLDSRFGLDQGFETYDDAFGAKDEMVAVVQRDGAAVNEAALEWIDAHQREPFFLFVHYYDAHAGYDPPPPFRPNSTDRRALYAGEVSYVDHCIGQLVERLEARGIFDDTLIVITSDHGEMLDEHGEGTHGFFVYQAALHVPLIIKLPGEERGATVQERVGIVDLVPTLCGLLDFPPPAPLHGVDLGPLMRAALEAGGAGASAADDRLVYFQSMTPTLYDASPLVGLAGLRWKYIHSSRPELFDLDTDPREMSDRNPAEPQRSEAMRARLESLLAQQYRAGAESRAVPGTEDLGKIRALGYTGGSVDADFDLESMVGRDEPRSVFSFYERNQEFYGHLLDGRLEDARALGEQLMAERPNSIDTRLNMSWLAMQRERYDECIAHAEHILAIDPEHPRARHALGAGLRANGELARASDQFRRVLQVWPDDAEANFLLARCLLDGGQPSEALPHFKTALAGDPSRTDVRLEFAKSLLTADQPQEALAQFEYLLRVEANSAAAHYGRGLALKALGRRQDAVQAFERTLEIEPGLASARAQIAELAGAQGATDESIALLRRTLADSPDDARGHLQLGALLGMRGELEEAEQHFRSALAIDPTLVDAHAQLGVALRMRGQPAEAVQHLTRAVELDGQNARAIYALGQALEELGERTRAAQQYRRVLTLVPNDANARAALQRVEGEGR